MGSKQKKTRVFCTWFTKKLETALAMDKKISVAKILFSKAHVLSVFVT